MNIYKCNDFKRIYCSENFWDDYRSLFGKNKKDFDSYCSRLISNLSFLDNIKNMNLALQNQNFEKLSNSSFYSIRHVSKLNPRVIFICFVENTDNLDEIILLTAFLEKDKKDYAKAIQKANSILKSLQE